MKKKFNNFEKKLSTQVAFFDFEVFYLSEMMINIQYYGNF